jgi:hypothetical protein
MENMDEYINSPMHASNTNNSNTNQGTPSNISSNADTNNVIGSKYTVTKINPFNKDTCVKPTTGGRKSSKQPKKGGKRSSLKKSKKSKGKSQKKTKGKSRGKK